MVSALDAIGRFAFTSALASHDFSLCVVGVWRSFCGLISASDAPVPRLTRPRGSIWFTGSPCELLLI